MISTILVIILAAGIGVLQVMLDTLLFSSVFAFKAAKGIISVLIKLAIYGLGFWLLFGIFKAFLKASAIGFAIGFFPCLFIYCIKKIKG